VRTNDLGKIKELIKQGANVNAPDYNGGGYSHTPLMEAAWCDNPEALQLLIDNGARVNDTNTIGDTALILAVDGGAGISTLRILVDNNANANVADRYGDTPLILAAKNGDAPALAILLDHGASTEAQNDDGDTALITAIAQGNNTPAMVTLIDRTANLDTTNNNDSTALIEAATRGYLDVVRRLLEKGADPGIKDTDGMTALDWAVENEDDTMIILLRAANDTRARRQREKAEAERRKADAAEKVKPDALIGRQQRLKDLAHKKPKPPKGPNL
jgi:ankyrin repeat protein